MNRGFLNSIFGSGQRRLGSATMQAKAFLYAVLGGSSPYNTALIHSMTVFGDPALKLQFGQWQFRLPLVAIDPHNQ